MASKDIQVGAPVTATGGIVHAPLGSKGPADVRIAWDKAFVPGGYVSEDGVTRTIDASDDKIKAWGGDTVRVVRTEHSVTYKLTFLESRNADTLKLLFGDENVKVTGDDITVNLTSGALPHRYFGLDMKDGDYKSRELILDGQLSLSGDVTFVHSDVIKYEVEIEAFADENGVKAISMSGLAVAKGA